MCSEETVTAQEANNHGSSDHKDKLVSSIYSKFLVYFTFRFLCTSPVWLNCMQWNLYKATTQRKYYLVVVAIYQGRLETLQKLQVKIFILLLTQFLYLIIFNSFKLSGAVKEITQQMPFKNMTTRMKNIRIL